MIRNTRVPNNDKSTSIQSMFEFTEISETELCKARNDPVFIEAKMILSALPDGSPFPKRLFELYKSQIPKALSILDKTAHQLINLISDVGVRGHVRRLWENERETVEQIDVTRLPQTLRPVARDDRYILRSLADLAIWTRIYGALQMPTFGGESEYRRTVATRQRDGYISIGWGAKDERTNKLMLKRDEYAAYRVFNPLWDRRLKRYEPKYVTFPLKWVNDTHLIEQLYAQHKRGKNVLSVFKSMYNDESKLISLKDRIESCPITQPYGPLFDEIADSYTIENYRVSATGLLPMIEGMIWSFAWWWNETYGGLFDKKITPEEYKHSGTFQLVASDGITISGRPNIGALLRQTKLGQEVYFEVVEYLVVELFEERNPVLHGREPFYGTHQKAATLLFVVETLERQIMSAIKKHLAENFDKLFPNDRRYANA